MIGVLKRTFLKNAVLAGFWIFTLNLNLQIGWANHMDPPYVSLKLSPDIPSTQVGLGPPGFYLSQAPGSSETLSGEASPSAPSPLSSLAQQPPLLQQAPPPRPGFLQSLNPDIRVEVNFIGNKTFKGEGNEEGPEAESESDILRNRFTVKEVELGFQASVDPYARADVFFSGENLLGDESEVGLEEAWLTLIRLPLGAQARLGKFR
ncbi:MAG TPA: hypothetical protein VNM22_14140, partial [Candidatus Limnocylindrales bacterium]|nr:hypothetical protein [Candidatus Limnocylindrales bacterium]